MRASTIRQLCARPDRSSAVGRRGSLTTAERVAVFKKTGGTCHVCGGRVGRRWQADHVVPHRLGGQAVHENYLPICKECNRLRWFHSPPVIRLIMRLGVYAKLEIRRETELGERLLILLRNRLQGNRNRRKRRQVRKRRCFATASRARTLIPQLELIDFIGVWPSPTFAFLMMTSHAILDEAEVLREGL
jgi:hypothetical protein